MRESEAGFEYMPFSTDIAESDWLFASEKLVWKLEGRCGTPPLTVMTHRRASRKCTVFIPGLNGRWSTWLPVLHAMRLLDVDPGAIFILDFENTRFPSSVDDLRLVCEEILAFVSSGGYEQLDVVGHSTGGCLATFMCTVTDGDIAVSSLYSICGTFVSLFEASHMSLRDSLTSTKAARNLAKLRLIAMGGPLAEFALEGVSRSSRLSRYFLSNLYAFPGQVPAAILQSNVRSFDMQALRDTLEIGFAYDYRSVYPCVTADVRLVVGDRDPLVGVADAYTAETLLPHFQFAVLKETGHFPNLERPVTTVSKLFLQ